MSNMSEDIQYAGSDTRPPMLDRTDFESWQQRIRLYCLGKDNGENIMKSITEGPFQMGTFIQTPAEETEGALQLGPERARVFTDLSAEEKERYKADIRATNILLQAELERFITEVKLNRDAELCSRYPWKIQWNNQEEPFQRNNARGNVVAGNAGGQNRGGNVNPGQAKPIKCYNCNGLGHIARECPRPKRLQDSDYFKDKMLLMQAQENGAVLDEEQLLFLAGEQVTNFDDDVDDPNEKDLALNTMFMVNLSSEDPIYDEVGPSYDSNTPFEVQDHDTFVDHMDEYHKVHEMQNDVQHNYVVDSDAEYTSDSKILFPYKIIVNEDNEEHVLQSNVLSVPK
ncbi:retrovirus-related pol polyprotein from transposon TNT 1-94 [Tanacetum coccineum]|uniref:Retrovirus-related pol polyprotein from transposon TNT 1-94 n=1 Tax=Tanacetum coccineum TaxID=301880 RepID=A0ABQ5EZ85_9ASTR